MPEQKEKKTYGHKLAELLYEVTSATVSREEVKALLDTFIEFFNKLTRRVEQSEQTFKDQTERFGREVAAYEKRLRALVEKGDTETLQEVERQLNELRVDLGFVESTIKHYDDTALQRQVSALKETLATLPQYDPTDLISRIDALTEEVKNVKSVRGGGGVTNLRIIQAFKTILKTEAPVGAINGSNTEYTVSQPIFAVLSFSLNGETIAQLPNYTVKGNKLIFSTALPAAYSGKDFEVKYI